MKKYVYEASKKQWEKPTEPKYLFCPPAQVTVYADSEEEALVLAQAKLKAEYAGTGFLLGEAKLVAAHELPVDWSYGYGDERKSGPTGTIGDLVGNHVIR
jgi:hypothetical protein